MVLGQLMGGIAQGMQMGRQGKVDKEERDLKKQMLKLQMANAKIAQQQGQLKADLVNAFLPQFLGTGQEQQQAPAPPGLLDQMVSGMSPMSPGPDEAPPAPAQMSQGSGLLDKLASMDPMMAAVLKEASGIDFQGARRDSQPKMGETDLINRALSGDQQAQAILDAQLDRKKQMAAAGKTDVRTDVRNIGPVPPGYRAVYDAQGNPTQMIPIPGGPADIEAQEKADKLETKGKIRGKVGATAVDELTELLNLLEGGEVAGPRVRDLVAKGSGPVAFYHTGKPTGNFVRTLQSIRDTISIDRLLEIKESGAGLGHIPQAQLEALARSLGAMDAGLSDDLLKKNLLRVMSQYEDVVRASLEDVTDPTFRGLIAQISPDDVKKWERRKGGQPPAGPMDPNTEAERLIQKYGRPQK